MSLITERAAVMPKVGDTNQMNPLDLSQAFSPLCGTETDLMPPVAQSAQVPQPSIPGTLHADEEWGTLGVHPFLLHQLS